MTVRIFHDVVFEHPTKETAARTKLHIILQNNEVSKILRGAVDDADDEWIAQPWRIPAVQIWGKICHKYEGMTDMLTGTMMEELANIITCVAGNARQRRTVYRRIKTLNVSARL
jgi:ribosomal protein L1